MKEYNFEYVNRKARLVLLWCALGISIAILGITAVFRNYGDWVWGTGIIFSVALPVIFFAVRKNNLKKTGIALIGADRVILEVYGTVRIINFDNIKYYRTTVFNGIQLELTLRKGQKLNLYAHINYCVPEAFGTVCRELEDVLETYIHIHQGDDTPIRRRSIFEKIGMLVFSLCLFVTSGTGILYGIAIGNYNVWPLAILLGIATTFLTGSIKARKTYQDNRQLHDSRMKINEQQPVHQTPSSYNT